MNLAQLRGVGIDLFGHVSTISGREGSNRTVMTAESPARAQAPRAIDPIDVSVGQRIRMVRRQRAQSLQRVAERADVSIGFLSQLERGLSSPSLRDLIRIATALDVEPSLLFDDAVAEGWQDGPAVVRVADRREIAFHDGIVKELLSPPTDGTVVLYMVTLEPKGRTGETSYSHRGEEAGLVLQGRLLLTVETTDYLLNEGDSFRFISTKPHRFSNPSNRITRVLWVNAAPVLEGKP